MTSRMDRPQINITEMGQRISALELENADLQRRYAEIDAACGEWRDKAIKIAEDYEKVIADLKRKLAEAEKKANLVRWIPKDDVDKYIGVPQKVYYALESRSAALGREREELKRALGEANAIGYLCGRLENIDGVFSGGCGEHVDREASYRCADCTASFHRDCIRKHFKGGTHESPSEVRPDGCTAKPRCHEMHHGKDCFGNPLPSPTSDQSSRMTGEDWRLQKFGECSRCGGNLTSDHVCPAGK